MAKNPTPPPFQGDEVVDADLWRHALGAAISQATTTDGLRVVVELTAQLRPWLKPDKRPIGGDQHLPLVRREQFVGEQSSLDVGHDDISGESRQVAEMAAE